MARRTRIQTPGFHHIFSRATGGSAFFRDDDDRRYFVNLLEQTAARLQWRLLAYCLMTTHYHVVVETRWANLSVGMQRVNSLYVQSFNDRWDRFGSLVAGRFACRWIETEEYLLDVCAYVFLNPVKANLCEHASQWPWSGGTFLSAVPSL